VIRFPIRKDPLSSLKLKYFSETLFGFGLNFNSALHLHASCMKKVGAIFIIFVKGHMYSSSSK